MPTFSKNFFWGVACSAFQVEGDPQPSDWSVWVKTPGKITDGTNADRGTNFFKNYKEDFQLAKELGSNAFRISLAWERIEPECDVWSEEALNHYEQIILSIREDGMEPIVCLQHFVLPEWLAKKGSLLADDFVLQFADYAEKVVARFSGGATVVKYWLTFNEPMVLALEGYHAGVWPPGLKNVHATIKAVDALAMAHIEATRRIRNLNDSEIKLSIAHHWRAFVPASWNPFDIFASKMAAWIFNDQFLKFLITGKMRFWLPGAKSIKRNISLPEWRSTLDFIGINYYGRIVTSASLKPPFINVSEGDGEKTDLGWAIYPQGLFRCLKELSSYKTPIMVTENGLADAADVKREKFIEMHLKEIDRAKSMGYSVIGYLYWSLTDNFEWAFGLAPRFGLVAVDYANSTLKARPSFFEYKRMIAERSNLDRSLQ